MLSAVGTKLQTVNKTELLLPLAKLSLMLTKWHSIMHYNTRSFVLPLRQKNEEPVLLGK